MTNIITEKIWDIKVQPGQRRERIDKYLANCVENASRNRIQQLIEANCITVNGNIIDKNYKVCPNDQIIIKIPVTPHPENPEPENIQIKIVYEDEYLAIVDKPAGMVVHPAFGNYTGTLVNALLYHLNDVENDEFYDKTRPGIVHRIDKDTSGLLLIAKDQGTHHKLAIQFAQHTIEREYWAIAWGIFKEKKGTIIRNIIRSKKDRKVFTVTYNPNEGKHAITHYEIMEEFEFLSLVKLKLETGRTHQIRVHLNSINHPIFGDETYGGRKIVYGSNFPKIKSRVDNLLEIMKRQALHAKTLGFIHPATEKFIKFDSELPEDFKTILELVRK
jgi:23S rRNA pseudouridine1911/1915/1917 synthase